MASNSSRVKQEQLRKRRNNLLRRHNDFWLLYSIKSWLIMEGPNGRIYTYHSHPGLPVPTTRDMHGRPHPAIHKTPADYLPDGLDKLVVPELPLITPLARSEAVWRSLSLYFEERSS